MGVGFNRETESFIQETHFPHPHTSRWFGKTRNHAFHFLRNVKLEGILQQYWLLLARFMEKALAPHSSALAWRIPWATRSLVGCSPWGRKESDTTERLHFHFSLSCIGKGNGNPIQCSCLENPRDREPGRLPSMGLHGVGHD